MPVSGVAFIAAETLS